MKKKNKKKIIITIVILMALCFVFLTPISLNADGAYNSITRTIWCRTESSCLHEAGHALDQDLGYPSKTWQFSLSVRMYLTDEIRSDSASQMSLDILNYQFQHHPGIQNLYMSYPMGELYAFIFASSDGKKENIPKRLREFYDWNLAEELLEKYN